MKERGIIFSSAEVRAISEGRKSQTRRVMEPQPEFAQIYDWKGKRLLDVSSRQWCWRGRVLGRHNWPETVLPFCPYGVPGDCLWVRETFALESNYGLDSADAYPPPHGDGRPTHWEEHEDEGRVWLQPHYRATDPDPHLCTEDQDDFDDRTRWTSSTRMPRWASRLTLEITDVRVQRLQEISEEDARDEGCDGYVCGQGPVSRAELLMEPGYSHPRFYRDGFEYLWDSLYAKKAPWASNPWVWAISFRKEPSNG